MINKFSKASVRSVTGEDVQFQTLLYVPRGYQETSEILFYLSLSDMRHDALRNHVFSLILGHYCFIFVNRRICKDNISPVTMKHDKVFHQFVWNYYLRFLAFLTSVNDT